MPPSTNLPKRPQPNRLLVHALGCVDLGDSFAREGDRNRALHYYGNAVNDYLDAGLYDLAAELCGRMLDRFPDVVRARFTRAFLALGKGLKHEDDDLLPFARAELAEYVRAARQARQQLRATEQLRRLAACTERAEVVEIIAEQMLALGRPHDAREVLAAFASRRGGDAYGHDPRERWAHVLRGA